MSTHRPFFCMFVGWSYGTYIYMHECCERIVAGHSVPWTQYILVLVNFIGETMSEICKALLY